MKRKPAKFLPNDYAHCTDYKCPSHDRCLRFCITVRDDEGFVIYANFDRPSTADKCQSFIGEAIP